MCDRDDQTLAQALTRAKQTKLHKACKTYNSLPNMYQQTVFDGCGWKDQNTNDMWIKKGTSYLPNPDSRANARRMYQDCMRDITE